MILGDAFHQQSLSSDLVDSIPPERYEIYVCIEKLVEPTGRQPMKDDW